MKYTIVERNDELDLDKSLKKNKWKWDWIEKEVEIKGEGIELVEKHIRKLKEDGKAYCEVCNTDISYGGRGWNSLESHIKSKTHLKAPLSIKSNYEISGSSKSPIYGLNPFFQHAKLKEATENLTTYMSVKDRTVSAETTILAFCAENALSLSMVPRLVNFSKTLSRDSKALSGVKLLRHAAGYKMTNGIAKMFSEHLYNELKVYHFSLNFD